MYYQTHSLVVKTLNAIHFTLNNQHLSHYLKTLIVTLQVF